MPSSALAVVTADHVSTLDRLPDILERLACGEELASQAVDPPQALRDEHAASFGDPDLIHLKKIGSPSTFTCPDCGGALFELADKRPLRYLCYTGHAYTARALTARKDQTTDFALWSSLRAMQEKRSILQRLIEVQAATQPGIEHPMASDVQKLTDAIVALRSLVEQAPS
jgi:two-component system chemotaxis response regulator CheB